MFGLKDDPSINEKWENNYGYRKNTKSAETDKTISNFPGNHASLEKM